MQVKNILWILSLILWNLFPLGVFAEDSPQDKGKPSDQDIEDEVPSMELLEFLADFETDEGQWLDPEDLDQIDLPEPKQGENEKSDK